MPRSSRVSKPGPILVIGDVIRDILVQPKGPIRPDTDTPARIDLRWGGSASNTALWLGALGAQCHFFGRVGATDVETTAEHFRHFGVEASLQPDPDHPTGSIAVIIEGDSRSMLTDRGANAHLDVEALEPSTVAGLGWLHLTGYSFFHTTQTDALLRLIDRLRLEGTIVSLDCSSVGFLQEFGLDRWWRILQHVDIVRGNADEAMLITGTDDSKTATSAIAERGHLAVITRGAQGALWCEQGGTVQSAPAAPLGPGGYLDPTGAGDSFSAGVIDAMWRGEDIADAVAAGLQLSARVVSQWGASPS
jgi:sugar/nucleoside kinase (ribokinase family)